jgi:hypothetical protein
MVTSRAAERILLPGTQKLENYMKLVNSSEKRS